MHDRTLPVATGLPPWDFIHNVNSPRGHLAKAGTCSWPSVSLEGDIGSAHPNLDLLLTDQLLVDE